MRQQRSESLSLQPWKYNEIRVSFNTTRRKTDKNAVFRSGKYYHSQQQSIDFTKVFVKDNYECPPQSHRSIISQRDPYLTKLQPHSQSESLLETGRQSTGRKTARAAKMPTVSFTQRFRLKNAGKLPSQTKTRLVLMLYNHNLVRCKSIDQLKYCYYNLPVPKQFGGQREAELGLQEVGKDLIEHLKIGQITLYFYTKSGEPLKSLFECHPYHQTIIVSSTKQFNGIDDQMELHIKKLESVLPKRIELSEPPLESLEQHIQRKYKQKIMNIADFLQSPTTSLKLNSDEIQTLYKRCQNRVHLQVDSLFKKKFNAVQPVNQMQLRYKSPQEYLNDKQQIVLTQKQHQHEEIIEKYDRELKEIHKSILQNHHFEADQRTVLIEGKLVEREHTQYTDAQVQQLSQLQASASKQRAQDQPYIQPKFGRKLPIASQIPESKKDLLTRLSKSQKNLLYNDNIPKLTKRTKFTRKELYQAYILFKALEAVSSQMQKDYYVGEGVTFEAFRNGIYQVFMQPRELAVQMFKKIDMNFSGNLNWTEFLDLMVVIKAKTLAERVNLFIRIADKDGNGLLSREEILQLTKICLQRFVENEPHLLDMLCEYFTKLIFETLGVGEDKEIPLEKIREAILSGGPNSELLTMFCGADFE